LEPVRIQLSEIIDFGVFITLVGVDAETNEPIAVYVDRRPPQSFLQAWQAEDLPEPILYQAERLMLTIDILLPDDPAGDTAPSA
jgi:hypothetical protein